MRRPDCRSVTDTGSVRHERPIALPESLTKLEDVFSGLPGEQRRLDQDFLMTTACALAFGGNSTASEDHFQQAIAELANAKTVCKSFGKVIRSAPMGASAGSEFVNSAGVFETNLSPKKLLETIHEIESGLGRKRSLHWGPRPIDIDVLFYGQQVIDTAAVVIPHPCLWYRSFVLKPLNEICPDWIHPVFNEDIARLNDRLTHRPLQIHIQNQLADLPALQIAQQCWPKKDHPFHPCLDPDVDDDLDDDGVGAFCKIVIQRLEQEPVTKTIRMQPRHESGRIIRCFLQPENNAETFRQFLNDMEAAVLG